jgi:hypothetical protein
MDFALGLMVHRLVQVGCTASLMVQVEVQVGAWLMHLFMVHVDYRLFWYMLITGCLVQVDWYRFTTVYLTVIV